MPLHPGTTLGPYEVVAPLGAGGMGEVYRARDTRLDRSVAIKVLPSAAAADPHFRERFEREARAASALNHPNILSLFDVGREHDADYIVTELVDGNTLRERIGERALPVRDIVALGAQIADGLATAHAAGLVHRDLKPENLMVTRDGRVKILDFGLAKPLDNAMAGQHTQTAISQAGMLVGTVGYVAPEQVRGQSATAQSDLFSLGVVLYEMATGRRAFNRPTVVETLNAVLNEELPELPAEAPRGLQQIIAHCLEKEPARRFQNAADVAFALRSFASSSNGTVPSVDWRQRRNWTPTVLAASAGLALLASGYVAARLTAPATVDLSALRMVPYAVEPAGEASSAISPDGRSVAYMQSSGQLSDIVVKSDSAPAPAVLSLGHPIDTDDLSWSPDGARIYFQQGRNVESVAAIGGDPRVEFRDVNGAALAPDAKMFAAIRVGTARPEGQLFVGLPDRLQLYQPPPVAVPIGCVPNYVRFSPDGKKILLWLGCDASGIVIVPTPDAQGRGGPARRLWAGAVRSPQGIAWLNDSRHVVFSSGEFESPGAVWLGDTSTGALTHVTEALAPLMSLSAARDNTVAFTEAIQDFDVVELPAAGGVPRPIVTSARYDGSPAWSPSGQMLAYVVNRADGDEIWIRTGSDRSERRLTTLRDFPEERPDSIRALTFSPDGQWLALTAYGVSSVVTSSIWVVPAHGGTPRRVSQKGVLAVRTTWAPDGRTLAIYQGREELVLANIGETSTTTIPLPPGVGLRDMEWAPTANVIAAFESRPEGGPRPIVLIDPSNGRVRRLGPVEWSVLAWSRDSRLLYGIAAVANTSELQGLDVGSGALRTVATYEPPIHVWEDFGQSRRLTWAPDGRSLVTTMRIDRSNVWLMKGLRLPERPWWPFAGSSR